MDDALLEELAATADTLQLIADCDGQVWCLELLNAATAAKSDGVTAKPRNARHEDVEGFSVPQQTALRLSHTYMLQNQYQRTSCEVERAFGMQTATYPGIALCVWAKAKLRAGERQKKLMEDSLTGFQPAKEAYECLFELDPYRIEGTDIYSNVLYVLGENTELALLAQRTALHSPEAAETHCIQGNLFSSEGRHAAAVAAFKRALAVKRDCESAWTLMGHEYIELRETDEAVKCYRNAVDINPRDYRAWYGLAQAYELLGLPQYAAFYYHRAATLRPGDPRMWCALGMVYQNAGQDATAATCYRRAYECNDREGLATIRLAQLARSEADDEQAELFYAEHVKQRDEFGDAVTPEVAEALIFSCEVALRRQDFDNAERLAKRALELPYPQEAQVASAYMKDIAAARRGLGQAAGAHAASLADALRDSRSMASGSTSGMFDSGMQSASASGLGLTGESEDLDLTRSARKPTSFAKTPAAVRSAARADAAAAAAGGSMLNDSDMSSIGFSGTQSHILTGNSTLPSLPSSVRRSSVGGRRRRREGGGGNESRASLGTSMSPGHVSLGALDVSGVASPGNDSMMSSSTLSSHRSERGRGL